MDKKKREQEEKTAAKEETVAPDPVQQPEQEQEKEKEKEKKPDPLEVAKAEAEDFKRKWYLVSAEYDNYRKRTAAESARKYAEGRADVVKGLFPIADNLERALAACNDENTKKGIAMITASFENLLKEENIETIDPLGDAFDATECEAIMAVDPEEGETSGTVKQVYRKGYKQNGKVLRYAQVVVVK